MATPGPALPSRLTASAALLATAAWGSTFVVTRTSLDELGPVTFLLWRFGTAVVVLGVLLVAGFLLQTTGLQHTSAGLSGFRTGPSVVMVPVLASVLFAGHVTCLSTWATPANAVGVTTVSVVVAAALSGWAVGTGGVVVPRTTGAWTALLSVALVAREALAATGWLGGVLVVLAMETTEIGVRECCDVGSPRVEWC